MLAPLVDFSYHIQVPSQRSRPLCRCFPPLCRCFHWEKSPGFPSLSLVTRPLISDIPHILFSFPEECRRKRPSHPQRFAGVTGALWVCCGGRSWKEVPPPIMRCVSGTVWGGFCLTSVLQRRGGGRGGDVVAGVARAPPTLRPAAG